LLLAPTPAIPAPTNAAGTATHAPQKGSFVCVTTILYIEHKKFLQNKKMEEEFKDIPVCLFLAVSIVVVFAMYVTTIIKTIPCGKSIMSSFCSNFVHVEPYHLMANLFALYALARVERDIGSRKFFGLIIFLLIFTSISEVVAHKMFSNLPCSIGFSGILFGIMAWELTAKKDFNIFIAISIFGVVVAPSIQNSKASLVGHAVGAITGIIGGILWKSIV
jgi:hypothetical protein